LDASLKKIAPYTKIKISELGEISIEFKQIIALKYLRENRKWND